MKELLHTTSSDSGSCRFSWHPRILAFFATSALVLSILSSLDCKFLLVDLDFIPTNYYDTNLGFGMWSYSAPGGRCLTYRDSQTSGGFVSVIGNYNTNEYSSMFMNNDINWSMSRILALVGGVFGTVSLISSWMNVCKSEPHLVDVLAYSTITAFMCESAKFGLFLGTSLCTSDDYWFNTESDELSGSKDCKIDRGAFMSIAAIASYCISMVFAVGYAARPKFDDYYTHDAASITSWGESGTGSTANAALPTMAQPPDADRDDRLSSVGGYDWSVARSAPSTIPSIAEEVVEDYGLRNSGLRNSSRSNGLRASGMSQQKRPSMHGSMPPLPPQEQYEDLAPNPGPRYANGDARRQDDMSTLTWDAGY